MCRFKKAEKGGDFEMHSDSSYQSFLEDINQDFYKKMPYTWNIPKFLVVGKCSIQNFIKRGSLEWWSNIHYSKIFHINQSQHRPVFKSKSIHWAFEILLRNYLIWIFHRTFYLQPCWKSVTLSGNSFSGPKCCCQKKTLVTTIVIQRQKKKLL